MSQENFWQQEKDFKANGLYLDESIRENRPCSYEVCRLHAYAQQGDLTNQTFPAGVEKIQLVYDFAIENNPDLRFSSKFKVLDLGGNIAGKAVPGTRRFPMSLDDRFEKELSLSGMEQLLRTIIHEGLHQSYPFWKNIRLGRDHPEIHEEAALRTRRLRKKYHDFLEKSF